MIEETAAIDAGVRILAAFNGSQRVRRCEVRRILSGRDERKHQLGSLPNANILIGLRHIAASEIRHRVPDGGPGIHTCLVRGHERKDRVDGCTRVRLTREAGERAVLKLLRLQPCNGPLEAASAGHRRGTRR